MSAFFFFYPTPLGVLAFAENGTGLTHLLPQAKFEQLSLFLDGGEERETPLLKEAYGQLMEYFAGKRKEFSIPLSPTGTAFQKKVWDALLTIPYGETRSYGEIAKIIGREKASRAVGMANNRNPIYILIPCHRVIGANGSLTGYGGGLDMKEKLLYLEQGNCPFSK